VDVPVEENTGRIGLTVSSRRWKEENACNPYVVRQAPFRTFDAMAPVHGAVAATGTTAALRLEVAMPLDARPGSRRLALMVRQGAQCAELQLRRRR
jgi:hypothetical protein